MKRLMICLTLLGWGLSSGCSSLGFSTTPVAHLMTRETKQVLDASPRVPAVPRELQQEVLPVHYLQPGDELLIETTDYDTTLRIPADQRVLADGTVDLAEYGRVVVVGLSLEQAEAAIQDVLARSGLDPTAINVRLIEPVDRYYVIGEVNSPGSYPLVGHETVLDGLMAAGGLTSRGSVCKMLLARPTHPGSCRVTLPVCYRAITQLGDTTTNYQLRPGDRIFVARQTMLDELMFWRNEKTCSRCCNRHRPCADPSSAAGWGSTFGAIADLWIAPPSLPTAEEGAERTEEVPFEAPLNRLEPRAQEALPLQRPADEPRPTGESRPAGEPRPAGESRPADEPGPSGELDFGAFLRNSDE